jgi:hypothetical protein
MRRMNWLQTYTVFWLGGGAIPWLFNIHGVSDVRQTEIYIAEPLVHDASTFKVEKAIEKLKIQKSPGFEQIPAEFINAGGRTMHCEIHNFLVLYGVRRNCPSGKSQSVDLFIRRVNKQIVVIIEAYHFCQLRTKFYVTSCCQG